MRTASRLAWPVSGLALALIFCALLLTAANRTLHAGSIFLVSVVACALVGGLIASRRPASPIGWLFLGSSLCFALQEFTTQYALYGLVTEPGSLPLARAMAWPQTWFWVPGVSLSLIFLPLYFPNGRLLSSRWRWVVRLAAVLCAYSAVVAAFLADEADPEAGIANPLVVPMSGPVVRALEGLVQSSLAAVLLAAVTSLALRFRRSRGEERQQMKWLIYAAAANFAMIVLTNSLDENTTFSLVADRLTAVVFAGIPVAVGVAVLRYRLYDIDVIVNRTLVYGVLTVSLASIYLGGVAALQYALRALTGQEQQTQLVIVASTLVIAALFNPLRQQVQAFVDRRFYRRKYDARKTLEAFGARLRDETDVGRLGEDFVGVVQETLQPEHVSLWLREPERGEKA